MPCKKTLNSTVVIATNWTSSRIDNVVSLSTSSSASTKYWLSEPMPAQASKILFPTCGRRTSESRRFIRRPALRGRSVRTRSWLVNSGSSIPYFTIDQTADTLGLSPATVDRHWSFARAWLRREIAES